LTAEQKQFRIFRNVRVAIHLTRWPRLSRARGFCVFGFSQDADYGIQAGPPPPRPSTHEGQGQEDIPTRSDSSAGRAPRKMLLLDVRQPPPSRQGRRAPQVGGAPRQSGLGLGLGYRRAAGCIGASRVQNKGPPHPGAGLSSFRSLLVADLGECRCGGRLRRLAGLRVGKDLSGVAGRLLPSAFILGHVGLLSMNRPVRRRLEAGPSDTDVQRTVAGCPQDSLTIP